MSTATTTTSDSPLKKARTVPPVIGTHDGMFHCDEVLACFMLQQLPEYAEATILRTRDLNELAKCDIVVDVGAEFNASANRYDHHQRSFVDTFSTLRPELGANKYNVRLSSAGLVYTYFGEAVIRRILAGDQSEPEQPIADDQLRNIYLKVYESLIQEIDGIDNGVPMFDGEPAYRISSDLSSRVARLNASWTEDETQFDAMAAFGRAQQLVGAEFVDKVRYYATSWWPARAIVTQAVDRRHEIHASGAILELERFCPWKDHLHELEQERPDTLAGQPRYVLFESKPGDYRAICVPLNPKSFVCRKFLHASWRGLRAADLERVSGVPGANFVHANGFIGGAQTREAVLQMAVRSLESTDE